ncbi:hypothetical protein [Clostridium sp. HBUAS56017]|uniref:hypothetical protein n=1 Tax=Clostridium sp. HBUAS56017 TaxID=2571128 RepID=UPI001178893D|nr:hypothetical protein [Clostridium sp. HBUAS56017]
MKRKIQKCIYCDSIDLTISDIIPYALTGAKVTKKFVCRKHNKETNEKFESIVIEKWSVFRNHLGLKTRDGNTIRYRGDLIIDDIKISDAKLSDKSSLYSKQIFTTTNKNGEKIKIGNIDKLKQISDKKVDIIDMSNATIECKFSLNDLFDSIEMKRTIAKIAYEWHCYNNNILGYDKKYNKIISYILDENVTYSDIIENVIDGNEYNIALNYCEYGTHSIYEYIDKSGCCYVIFNFWNIIIYKIKVAENYIPNISESNIISMYKYNIDGSKDKMEFGKIGQVNVLSEKPEDALIRLKNFYIKNITLLLSTLPLTIFTVKQMIDNVLNDFKLFKNNKIELAKLLNYEDYRRVFIVHFLLILQQQERIYNLNESFNYNLKNILNTKGITTFNSENKKETLEKIIELDKNGTLVNKLEEGLYIFEKIYTSEMNTI